MSGSDGFNAPNTTQTPDILFDVLMAQMGDPELRVTLHLVRQTLGWRREWSDPTFSTTPAIAIATGLSEHGARLGVRAGMARGTIERADAPETRSYTYRLRVNAGQGQRGAGSTRGRVPTVEGQRGAGTSLPTGQGQGSTRGRVAIKKDLTPTLTPTNTHVKDPPRTRQARKRTATGAANGTPRARNERFDAFCLAWSIDPDKAGRKASLAGEFDVRCQAEGATIDQFREFYSASKKSGEWGRFIKPHTTADDFLAWRRTRGYGVDPLDDAGKQLSTEIDAIVASLPPDWVTTRAGKLHLQPIRQLMLDRRFTTLFSGVNPDDRATWPDLYLRAELALAGGAS